MRYVIFDTNIWIYLLEGRSELINLKNEIAQGKLVPVLTPVIFAEVLGWQEITPKEEKAKTKLSLNKINVLIGANGSGKSLFTLCNENQHFKEWIEKLKGI